jgi:hypothetical protein
VIGGFDTLFVETLAGSDICLVDVFVISRARYVDGSVPDSPCPAQLLVARCTYSLSRARR